MRIAVAFSLAVLSLAAAKPAPHHKPVLDELFARLAKSETPEDAKPVEDEIFALFVQSGSASVDLLMARGTAALAGGDDDTAKKLFDSVTRIAPKFAEGWHEKAQMQADDGDDEAAMVSLQKTVVLNPRQFAAMGELAQMLEEYGNKDGALLLYKRALALDPQLEGAAKRVQALEKSVEGQGI